MNNQIKNMKDKHDLLVWNYINFHISYELFDSYNRKKEDIKISELLTQVRQRIGTNYDLKKEFQFINSGNVFSLLYTSLVVPKELFTKNKEFGETYFLAFNEKVEDYFEITKGKYLNKFQFLTKLRNSIAHLNFAWDENMKDIKLWNEHEGNINFELKTNLNKLTNFSLQLSKFMANNSPIPN